MFVDQLNLNQLRVFNSVYKNTSMTKAAKELHLTQSGVSQHIKGLEEILRVKLFDRVNKRLIPTSKGKLLYYESSKGLADLETVLWKVTDQEKEISGQISIGMPIEFGNNVVMPLLAEFGRSHPRVDLRLNLDFTSVLNRALLEGDIDFAFVDDFQLDKRIKLVPTYNETLELYGSKSYLKSKGRYRHQRSYYESLEYLAYQKDEPLLKVWFSHHLKGKMPNTNVRATVMDVQGLARLAVSGLGVGVLPSYLVERLKKEGHPLEALPGSGRPLLNRISLAYLENKTIPDGAEALILFLKKRLKETV